MNRRRFLALMVIVSILLPACARPSPAQVVAPISDKPSKTWQPLPAFVTIPVRVPTKTSTPTKPAPSDGCQNCGAWKALPNKNAPTGRTYAQLFWTGSEVIVWGGLDEGNEILPNGGLYNPATDTWRRMSTAGAPAVGGTVAVWTGQELIVWGGNRDGSKEIFGGRYNPATDTWSGISSNGAPGSRWQFTTTAVWTGKEMLLWGGLRGNTRLADGARYDPAADTWLPIPYENAPSPRSSSVTVWTGSEMIVWGGFGDGYVNYNDGARFDPLRNRWTPMSSDGAPDGFIYALAVWTGKEMLVWGLALRGEDCVFAGGRYNPATDRWTAMSDQSGLSLVLEFQLIWIGDEMIFTGIHTVDNQPVFEMAAYDPNTDAWRLLDVRDAPPARYFRATGWTGTELILWGGLTEGVLYKDGARYRPGPLSP